MAEEVACAPPSRSSVQLDQGELGRTVDGDKQVEPPFGRVNLGQIDMEVAERVGLEARPLGLVAVDLGQLADPVTLQATMQRRADTSKYPFRTGRCRDSLMLSALGRLGWVSQGSSIWMSAISVCRRTATRW